MKQHLRIPVSRLIAGLCALLSFAGLALAQGGEAGNSLRQNQANSVALPSKQTRLADRYDQLELLAGRLAELSRSTQPSRARLLRELVAKSRERDIAGRFDTIISALESDRLKKASTGQTALQAELQRLLDLLLQEDRDRQIESERKRINKYLAEVKRLIRKQRGIRARTEGGDQSNELTEDQERLSETTNKLEEQIKATEGLESSDSNKPKNLKKKNSSADGKPEDKPSSKEQKAGDQPGDKKSAAKPGEAKPGADEKPGESKQGDGQPTPPPSNSKSSPSSEKSPMERAQQRLQKAQQRMKQAQQRLEEAKHDKAIERQEQAIRELEQAKAELERILRQLREEELQRMLVLLEARFRKMLDAQVEVYEQTQKVETSQTLVPEHEIEIASGRLSRQERLIVREADRALILLREDGTTVAFPEAIEQVRDDMKRVAKRLGEVKIGVLTQGLEEDIIAALEETLAALQKALKEQRQKKSQPQQQQSGEPGEQALVDQLAELRMIRALQNRINRRTKRYGKILGEAFAVEPDLLEALDELAIRQERIFQATRDLDTGRNQ